MDQVQVLHLELLKTIKFENISGEKIAADLLAHQELWHAVYVDFKWHIAVNQIPSHFWDPWHIYIFTIHGKEYDLRSLAETWGPTEIRFYCQRTFGKEYHWLRMEEGPLYSDDDVILDNKKLFLRLWWDDVVYPDSSDLPQFSPPSMEINQK
jgi:hypothetical protein